MKKLNNTAIVELAIASTILSYLSWILLSYVVVLFVPHVDNTNLIIAFVSLYYILILLFLLWGCKKLYKQYNHAETQRAVRWKQVLFILLVSFTIKYFLNGIMIIADVGTLLIPYGMDIIIIAPIAVFVNLKIANHKRRKTTTEN